MWQCDCDKHGVVRPSFAMSATTVNAEEQCTRCKNYAVWVKDEAIRGDDGSVVNQKVTVFKLKSKTQMYFDNLKDASNWIGFKSEVSLVSQLSKGKKHYYSRQFDAAVSVGHHRKIPSELQVLIEANTAYCFDTKTGKMVTKGYIDDLSSELGLKRSSIISSIHNQHINKKTGYIFSYNKNFDVFNFKSGEVEYKRTMTNRMSYVNHSEFTAYDDKELGVSYTKDTYGTWQDLLYT